MISIIMTLTLFAVIRLCNDLTKQENYWEIHTRGFILLELGLAWAYSVVAVILGPQWFQFNRRHGNRPFMEYSAVSIYALACALTTMKRSHSIEDKTVLANEMILPAIVAALLTCLFYSYLRNREFERITSANALKLSETRRTQLATELKLLRAQYHPHFLFNTLNTVYFQIDENNEEARHTIENLSDILRYQLYTPDEPVALTDEVETMKKFVKLCSMRKSRSLKLRLDISYIPPHMKIYPLLLIPLVENAFKFVGGDNMISISLKVEDETLSFRVTNSLSPDIIQKRSFGLGLSNLRRRLSILYPNDNHFLTTTHSDNEFSAEMRLSLTNVIQNARPDESKNPMHNSR